VVSAVCSDHQPHEPDAKLAPFSDSAPGISGLETLLPLTLKLVDEKVLSSSEAIASVTCQPADILGIDTGHLGIDATADICIFDPDSWWSLSEENIVSRGLNTPFLGWEFCGRVTHTLVGGQVVFELENGCRN
jgi:dihydroorotase